MRAKMTARARWPKTPNAVKTFSVFSLIRSVCDFSRNLRLIPLMPWSTATAIEYEAGEDHEDLARGPVEHAARGRLRAAAAPAARAEEDPQTR